MPQWKSSRGGRPRRSRVALGFEPLEGRVLLAVLQITGPNLLGVQLSVGDESPPAKIAALTAPPTAQSGGGADILIDHTNDVPLRPYRAEASGGAGPLSLDYFPDGTLVVDRYLFEFDVSGYDGRSFYDAAANPLKLSASSGSLAGASTGPYGSGITVQVLPDPGETPGRLVDLQLTADFEDGVDYSDANFAMDYSVAFAVDGQQTIVDQGSGV